MNLKLISAAAALVAGIAAAPAHAGALAAADLVVSGLALVNTDGSPLPPGAVNITLLSESRTGSALATYNGVTNSSGNSSNTIGATVNVAAQCSGDCVGALPLYGGNLENNLTTHLAPPPAANFALADMVISGNAIVNPVSASGLTRADASAIGPTNNATANVTIQNSARLSATFLVGTTFTGAVGLFADAYVRAFVTNPAVPNVTDSASGSIGWNLTITNATTGVTILSFVPGQLNQGLTVGTGDPFSDDQFAFNGNLLSGAATFNAGDTYRITINQSSNAIISSIPEPLSIALLGTALLAAGVATRRSQLKK